MTRILFFVSLFVFVTFLSFGLAIVLIGMVELNISMLKAGMILVILGGGIYRFVIRPIAPGLIGKDLI